MVQIIKCKCGKTFAACVEPECYTDKEWQNDLRKYVKGGCSVEMAEHGDWKFEACECTKTLKQVQNSLF